MRLAYGQSGFSAAGSHASLRLVLILVGRWRGTRQ
jgi:hypothetical protein